MNKKVLIFFIVGLFLLSFVSAEVKFPDIFIPYEGTDVAVVLSRDASLLEKVAVTNLNSWLANRFEEDHNFSFFPGENEERLGQIVLYDDEIEFVNNSNFLSLSTKCNNQLSNLYYDFNLDCSNFQDSLKNSNYNIEVFASHHNAHKITMVILANDEESLIEATEFLMEEEPGFIAKPFIEKEIECVEDNDCYPLGFLPEDCGPFYECMEGECVKGSALCTKETWLERILSWFGRLFGSEKDNKDYSNEECTSNEECGNLECLRCGEDEKGLTASFPVSEENPGRCGLGCM
jgi:hypothetical protein